MKFRIAGIGVSAAVALTALVAVPGSAKTPSHGYGSAHHQPYAGQHQRAITSFSEEEVSGLREGRGLGFAKPAELNGYPGPLHVLELATELGLSDEQRRAIEAIFARMKEEARAAGVRYLEAESAVDAAFRSGDATPERISALVRQAEAARAEVRLAHLKAHLATAPLLTVNQRHRYAELRGYSGPDSGHHRHHQRH